MKNQSLTVMCAVLLFLVVAFSVSCGSPSSEPVPEAKYAWQRISHPDAEDVAAQFAQPPAENAPWVIWGWTGPMTEEVICRDLDTFASKNLKAISIEAGYGMDNAPYLSEGWFKMVRFAVEQAATRGMKVWIIDEGKYPSGFAGGKFTQEKPELRMQGLSMAQRIPVEGGTSFTQAIEDSTIISASAANRETGEVVVLPITDGQISWTAPEGQWQVTLLKADFRTSVTRAVNNPTGGKDASNSLCDYLSADATRQFIEFTHEQYKKYCGDLFGSVILGFRGDEPDYGFTPWTPKMAEIFKAAKGYDVVPYLAAIQNNALPDDLQKVKADYWEVWSGLFRDNFFTVQADWHFNNGLEHITHLNHEDRMTALITSSGDFFRNMRNVQIPGIDAIWNQIWPGRISNFPKLASSSAHLFGKPRSFSESFAAYNPAPNPTEAKWVIDYEIARGISLFEFMFWESSAKGAFNKSGWMGTPEFADIVQYANRMCYVMSQGVSAIQIGLYYPTSSLWMGDLASDANTWTVAQALLDKQRDFDLVDEQSLTSVMSLSNGQFTNLSGQTYKVIVVPSCKVLPQAVYQRLKKFATQGGKVIFVGDLPTRLSGNKSFKEMKDVTASDFAWATLESSGTLTDLTDQALPSADLRLDQPCANFTYAHRKWNNAEVYFTFNENAEAITRTLTLEGQGAVEIWDAATGEFKPLESTDQEGQKRVSLSYQPYETFLLIVK